VLIFSNEGVENAGVVEQFSWKIFTLMPQLLLHYIGHKYMPTCSRKLAYNASCTCTCMVYVFSLSVLACNPSLHDGAHFSSNTPSSARSCMIADSV